MKKDIESLTSNVESHIEKFFAMHDGEDPGSGLYQRVIGEIEKILIVKTLTHVGGIQNKAAKILGINRNTLRKKVKEHGLDK